MLDPKEQEEVAIPLIGEPVGEESPNQTEDVGPEDEEAEAED